MLVIGNWKMHGRLAGNAVLMAAIAEEARVLRPAIEVALCVPFPYLAQAQAALQGREVAWGAQDISAHTEGAFTGEVAASMVAEFGARFVIVGHSERRIYHHESSALVAAKTQRAIDAGLTPIVCVGETRDERDAAQTETVIGAQLKAVLEALSIEQAGHIVIAYEPVWAIGSGLSASAQQAQEVHAFMRSKLTAKDMSLARVPILYGGSVKAANAQSLFEQPDIGGGLIGGASLQRDEFLAICRTAAAVVADGGATPVKTISSY